MALRALRFWVLSGGLLAGCVGGQSGTETGGGQKNVPDVPDIKATTDLAGGQCACALSERPGAAARGIVVEVDGPVVRVRVSELLGEGPVEPEVRFAAGDEIGGRAPAQICDEAAPLHEGDDVALVHVPSDAVGLACAEYQGCLRDRCSQLPFGDLRADACDQDCKIRTRGQCLTHAGEALLDGTMLAAPWGDQLQLPGSATSPGEPLSLPSSQISVLLDADACFEWLRDQTGEGPQLGMNVDVGDGEGGELPPELPRQEAWR